jgi:LysM repeat protein
MQRSPTSPNVKMPIDLLAAAINFSYLSLSLSFSLQTLNIPTTVKQASNSGRSASSTAAERGSRPSTLTPAWQKRSGKEAVTVQEP